MKPQKNLAEAKRRTALARYWRYWRGWQASAHLALAQPAYNEERWLGEVTMHLVAGLSHGISKVDVFAANWPPTSYPQAPPSLAEVDKRWLQDGLI